MSLIILSLLACKDGSTSTDDTQSPQDTEVPNAAPVIDSVTLGPADAQTADAIVATVVSSDVDGDTLTTSYAWTLDGQPIGTDSDTLPAALTAKGQSVAVRVTVDDGSESVSLDSAALVVANTAPVAEGASINPEDATTRDDLVCRLSAPPSDVDNDALTQSFVWTQNGVEVAAQGKTNTAGDTVLSSQTEGEDTWACVVTVSDGEESVTQGAEITLPPSLEVLLIWDVMTLGTPGLVDALEDAGLSVTYSDTDENSFDGSNPSLADYDAVVHLNGTTYSSNMPVAGQQALVDFVNAGGGYVHTEWNAYEVRSTSGSGTMASIQALARSSGEEGYGQSYTVSTTHPVVANVPSTFSTVGYCGGNVGTATNGATAIATEAAFGDAVAVNEVGAGRVVGFAHAANYANDDVDPSEYCLADPNLLQMMVDGVYWTLE